MAETLTAPGGDRGRSSEQVENLNPSVIATTVTAHVLAGAPCRRRSPRQRVLRTKGTICVLCGEPGADSVDHDVPVARGGTNDMGNLVPAHASRNQAKGNRTLDEWRVRQAGVTQLPAPGQYVELPDGRYLNSSGLTVSRPW